MRRCNYAKWNGNVSAENVYNTVPVLQKGVFKQKEQN
jgi:hypothetical protein